MRIFFSSPRPRRRCHIPRPVTHSRRPDQAGKRKKKQPPRNSTGAAFTYSISIFQSGFAPAAKATKELNTRFHRLFNLLYISIVQPGQHHIYSPKNPGAFPQRSRIHGYKDNLQHTYFRPHLSTLSKIYNNGLLFSLYTYLSPNAHPNKSGVIFAAFIGFYRDITKAICNPLRPCFITYKRLHRIRGYKIAACAAVLFPCIYHVLHPR